MKHLADQTVGMIGALASMPRRLAARQVASVGGRLRRGVGRNTSHAVVGRRLLQRYRGEEIERRILDVSRPSLHLLSENTFLRLLMDIDMEAKAAGTIDRTTLIEQSAIGSDDLRWLLLFDAFTVGHEPFSLRDVILAKKYAVLLADGADWTTIVQSVHRSANPDSLAAIALSSGGNRIFARFDDRLGELDGQFLLPAVEPADEGEDELFAQAEDAEAAGRYGDAIRLYAQCLNMDPNDTIAAFNRANCLRNAGLPDEAREDYWRAIRSDPEFVDAWFNLACLYRDRGEHVSARRHFEKAVRLDPSYRDAIYNLAAMAFDCEDFDTAAENWERYLALDPDSEWARNAKRGLQFIRQRGRKAG